MTQQEIQRENKLIGSFMGRIFENPLNYMYDISWDWLMPVVEKIASTKYQDGAYAYPRTFGMKSSPEHHEYPMVRFDRHQVFTAPTLIEATWSAVVDFIEWHNANNK